MAIVSAAVAAVAAAIATTTVATVATAVVAVSTVIGVAGLALTVAGAVTKNKDLLKAGQIMGYVGLAGGLAGGAIGGVGSLAHGGTFMEGAMGAYQGAANHVSQAWDDGIGSWFSADPGVAGQVDPTVATSGTSSAAGPATTTQTPPINPVDRAAFDAGQAAPLAPGVDPAQQAAAMAPTPVTPDPAAAYQSAVQASSAGPGAPSAEQAIQHSRGVFDTAASQAGSLPGHTAGAGSGVNLSGVSPNVAKAWTDLPDWMKYAAITSGVQGLSGLASGYFQGLSAEERLEFDKMIEANRQTQLGVTNARGAYSPMVSFRRPGALNTR